ncbi:MAG: trigger factor [Candidatus Absconditabacteria bacterium]|nr:trigger factor [Candidatus Absconditabacteria bacterium]MDD3868697.1 trigger factor [Candidatus Absconditabacteria bacterium]MDD4714387.1 trigger factor [Candidatus Absconditabacteria bacterium]
MAHKLQKGKQSNYELEITFTDAEQQAHKDHVLQDFQKDMNISGFRKGQVPLSMVEQNVKPEYLQMSIVEHLVNHGIQHVLKENPEIRFIGEPYDFSQDTKDGTTTVKLKLDVYPEVEVKKDSWKKEGIKPISIQVEAKEIEEALHNLQRNYADYADVEILDKETISKVAMEFLDKEGNIVDKGTTYIGEPEFTESPFWEKTFNGKKKGEEFEINYKEADLPAVVHAKGETKPTTVKFTIKDIKKQILPEFTPENIEKFFGKESEVKTEKELKEFIKKNIEDQKYTQELINKVEEFVSKIRGESMTISIPKTMVDEEFKSRVSSLEQRFGSKEKVEEYLKSMTEEQAKQFVEDIQKASSESLEKFFILNKTTELLGIEIDRNTPAQELAVERKIYEHFNPSEAKASEKEEKAEKKTPAKKTTKKAE